MRAPVIMYLLNFKHFLLRNVIITWSGCSNIIAFVGGVLLYEEPMTPLAALGCLANVLGIVLVAIS